MADHPHTQAQQPLTLAQLGWRPFYQQQVELEQWDWPVARVLEQHRNRLLLQTEQGELDLELHPSMPTITVGDWLQLTPEGLFHRLFERQSVFRRKAAGSKHAEQLIGANVDTLFIVSSLNDDFNLGRIERYLSLANDAEVEPVIVLTKADLCPNVDDYLQQVQKLDPMLMVEAVNGLDSEQITKLLPWCGNGKTVALLGSSGVGKSTLVNSLLGGSVQQTGGIREDDSKGRHTTTGRSLHPMAQGGLLLDTPGMRELQLIGSEQGLNATFAEITALAQQCRFADCQHHSEPGCAVQAAIKSGDLDPRRLTSFEKLQREQFQNNATLAEKHAKDREFQKMVKAHVGAKQRFKGRP